MQMELLFHPLRARLIWSTIMRTHSSEFTMRNNGWLQITPNGQRPTTWSHSRFRGCKPTISLTLNGTSPMRIKFLSWRGSWKQLTTDRTFLTLIPSQFYSPISQFCLILRLQETSQPMLWPLITSSRGNWTTPSKQIAWREYRFKILLRSHIPLQNSAVETERSTLWLCLDRRTCLTWFWAKLESLILSIDRMRMTTKTMTLLKSRKTRRERRCKSTMSLWYSSIALKRGEFLPNLPPLSTLSKSKSGGTSIV